MEKVEAFCKEKARSPINDMFHRNTLQKVLHFAGGLDKLVIIWTAGWHIMLPVRKTSLNYTLSAAQLNLRKGITTEKSIP